MSILQASIMLTFNQQGEELTVAYLQQKLSVDIEYLKQALLKLSIIKGRELLIKKPSYDSSKQIGLGDSFRVNKNLNYKQIMF